MCGDQHYDKGFHATGTFGTFGAAAAAAKLLKLDAQQTAIALGIAASQAAGLKCNFGTMTKPFHVGKSAQNGLMAARLAARGFTARPDAIECAQGFAATQVPGFTAAPVRPDPGERFAVEQNLFKYHAACYLTHSTIEAIADLRRRHGIGLDDVAAMTIYVSAGHLSVCNIAAPKTGLEIKFSIRHLAAMALDGADTAALETYSDANTVSPRYVEGRERIRIETRAFEREARHGAAISLHLKDGRALVAEANVGVPASDLEAQQRKLEAKFRALAEPVIGRDRTEKLVGLVARFEGLETLRGLMEAAA
jgi:2-methylcitrate dehydratase PrpD